MLPQGDDNSATQWNELISQLKSLGLHLPRYQSNGLIFALNTYGEVKQNRPFDSPPRYEDPLVLQEHDEAQRKLESEMRSVDMN
ncbi:MAG: hypothetical protein JKY14_05355 [Paraglaciecola sp.]|nr:hypothetical protein [Paraglaciecola sp.]